MDEFMQAAIEEAKKGLSENGIPIGSVLVLHGKIVGRGHNRRVQNQSAILHAEMDCIENAGRFRSHSLTFSRLSAKEYSQCTLYSTLSPCDMCSGCSLLYKGPEEYLRSRGVQLVNVDSKECYELMQSFIAQNPTLWNEDIGV